MKQQQPEEDEEIEEVTASLAEPAIFKCFLGIDSQIMGICNWDRYGG